MVPFPKYSYLSLMISFLNTGERGEPSPLLSDIITLQASLCMSKPRQSRPINIAPRPSLQNPVSRISSATMDLNHHRCNLPPPHLQRDDGPQPGGSHVVSISSATAALFVIATPIGITPTNSLRRTSLRTVSLCRWRRKMCRRTARIERPAADQHREI